MLYRGIAIDSRGERLKFEESASSREELRQILASKNLKPARIEEENSSSSASPIFKSSQDSGFAFPPMTKFDVEMGLRQLAAMIKSSVTLLVALETVADQAPSRAAASAWRRVAKRIVSGSSFAKALEVESRRFGEIAVRLAEVGESSGELEKALRRAADQLEARRNLKSAVINALVYPVIAVLMAVAVSGYLVVGVIPKLAEFLQLGGVPLPSTTRALIDVSQFLIRNSISITLGIFSFVALWVFFRFIPATREIEDVILLRIPVTGKILRLSGTALFSRSMQIMTESGVALIDALSTAARLMANRRFRKRIEQSRKAIIHGSTFASSLEGAKEFMPMLRKMASVGEVTGSLPEAFGETADFHEMLLALAVKRFGMMIEPVMIIITGLIVGFVYIAFFMALFAIAGTA
ncbi:MAG: type II secretion system F family protein [Kiritimatiellae bacterium]|nr:type II secretion system F family protein [Kiritimatiellia bacterium]